MPVKLRLHAAPATLLFLAAVLGPAVAGVVAPSGAKAASPQPKCGDTITTDTTLHEDLVNCPNNGIVIGADGITLDLNGHTIDGDGTPAAGCDPTTEFCDVGVVNFGHDGVTVMHGSLRQFGGGVNFGEVRHNRLLGISTSRNRFVGIQFFNSSRILVRNCSGNRTTSHEGDGVGVFDSRHVRILNSTFQHNAHVGIKPVDSTNGVIKGNLVAHNGDEGFLMEGGEGFQIRHNRLARNGAGITLGPGSHNVIKRNHLFRGRDGIRIEKGHGNLVANNVVVHARRAGIRLGIPHPFLGGAHNLVRRNRVLDSRVDGFLVNAKDDHSILKHNIAKGAGDDGFDVESHSAKLTSNRAVRNGDLGIEAVQGVIDGGGNVARHNGDPRQCTNIVCG
jgi:large repetitive protein